MGPLVASLALRSLAQRMMAERPRLRIWCSIKSPEALRDELMSGEIEVALCSTEHIPAVPELAFRPVGGIALAPIVRAGHPLAGREDLAAADTGSYPVAYAASGPALGHAARKGADAGALYCDNFEIVREVVRDSDAIWISSPRIAAEELAAGRMVQLAIRDMPLDEIKVGAMWLKEQMMSTAVKTVVDYAAALLEPVPDPR